MTDAVERMVEDMVLDAARRIDPGAFTFPPGNDRTRVAIGAAEKALESLGLPLSVLAALKEGTWKAVPVEPTPFHEDCALGGWPAACRDLMRTGYDAMLSAAPATPEDTP